MKQRKFLKLVSMVMAIIMVAMLPVTSVKAADISQGTVESKLNTLKSQYPAGSKWTRNFAGGSQCYAFAHFIFNSIFDRGEVQVGNGALSSNPTCYKLNNVASDITTIGSLAPGYSSDSLEQLLEKANPGDYLQVKRRSSGGPHSMIVTAVDATANTIGIFDANAVASNTVGQYTQNFSTFMEKNSGVTLYRYKYYQPDVCNCSESYGGQYVVKTNGADLNMRSGHNTSSSIITTIKNGTEVKVTRADGSWAHVEYNGYTGYCSMTYLEKVESAGAPKLHVWISDAPMGNVPASFKIGTMYYLCFELLDSITGKKYNEVANSSYVMTETIYKPDGSVAHTYQYANSDNNWIGHTVGNSGTYKGVVSVSGDWQGEVTVDFEVASPTPTPTSKPTATNTPKPTATNTPKPTATNTPKPTATNTPKPTATNTPKPTATNTPKPTAANTPKPTATNTPKPTATNTPTQIATNTPKPTATNAPMQTVTPALTSRPATDEPNDIEAEEEVSLKQAKIVLDKTTYDYDGKEHKPQVIVILGKNVLEQDKDYKVYYQDNVNPGKATVIVVGIGAYEDVASTNFYIQVKDGSIVIYNGFKYKINTNGTCNLVGTADNLTNVLIPNVINIGAKDYKVTGIEKSAFKNTKIQSIIIGDNITSIGESAFENCTKLTKVIFGKGAIKIGKNAFKNNNALKSITLPERLTKIESSSFTGCKNITIYALKGQYRYRFDQYRLDGTGTVAVNSPRDKNITNAKIPETVTIAGVKFRITIISKNAFQNCSKLKTVTLGNNVSTLGENCFGNCKALTKVTIGTNLNKINKNAFSNDSKLTTLVIKSAKLKTVYNSSLKGISGKAIIKVPSSKLKDYKKLLKGRGQGKSVKIVKL